MKEFENLKRFDWIARREKEIQDRHTAGFVHKDMPVTNPAVLHIASETLKNLKRLTNYKDK